MWLKKADKMFFQLNRKYMLYNISLLWQYKVSVKIQKISVESKIQKVYVRKSLYIYRNF